ncbi:FAD-dependent oxidoreductase [Geminocystis sp. NIES-3709]|uniref:FAD-dependent oxidoreductase n=1 Tax=Geminocystis sp. NIES-3709 TaxID=1617448 RepID=UPI0005FC7D8E|nr:FAD-dependent oxidoreductase [Geminocystis sp. NIES-3709]BAQ65165.1 dihydrolipoamide dehydrogenase of pyruvate dehydrogenase complex [Geminocystis sp. NIES-3709]
MKNNYDLVIIGGTKHAFFSAEYATKWGARVGLIIDDDYYSNQHDESNNLWSIEYKNDLLILDNDINYHEFLREKKKVIEDQYLSQLELLGIDIIFSKCQFVQNKSLTLLTNRDSLKSFSYLLAMTSEQLFSKNKKLNKNDGYLTVNELLFQKKWDDLPEELTIFGDDITAIYLINKLYQRKKKISLVSPSQQILPSEDEDISYQLQLFLESKGIKIYLNSKSNAFGIDRRKENDNMKTLRVTTKNLWGEETLELTKLGIKNNEGKIEVNSKLQTRHQQIYACGDLLGGYYLDSLIKYEAKIAVNNGLFFPYQKIKYNEIPYTLNTNPSIHRLGYTEKQARFLLSERIKVLKVFCLLKTLTNWDQDVTFIKIILDKNNYILGFHSFGFGVEEVITAITFIKKKNLSLSYLFKISFSNNNSYKLIEEIDKCWKKENQRQHQIILDLAETFFIWKRS